MTSLRMYVIRVTISPMIVDPFKRPCVLKMARGLKLRIHANIFQVYHFEGLSEKIYSANKIKKCGIFRLYMLVVTIAHISILLRITSEHKSMNEFGYMVGLNVKRITKGRMRGKSRTIIGLFSDCGNSFLKLICSTA